MHTANGLDLMGSFRHAALLFVHTLVHKMGDLNLLPPAFSLHLMDQWKSVASEQRLTDQLGFEPWTFGLLLGVVFEVIFKLKMSVFCSNMLKGYSKI